MILGLIPARAGSKRFPNKNMAMIGGRTLVHMAIDGAASAQTITKVVVSSDGADILAAARAYGADALPRPVHLAGDHVASIDVVRHALGEYPDTTLVALLQPTSPMRTAADIDNCVRLTSQQRADAVVSVTDAQLSHVFQLGNQDRLREVERMPGYYVPNGAVYTLTAEAIRDGLDWWTVLVAHAYRMPAGRSIDIDTPGDLLTAEHMLAATTDG